MSGPLIVIIGAGPGISQSVAKLYSSAYGYRVALLARNADNLKKLVSELPAGSQCFSCDASDPANLKAALQQVQTTMGDASVLLYNVAKLEGPRPRPDALEPEVLQKDLALNVTGALVAVQACAPQMKGKDNAAILLTGGGLAVNPHPSATSLALGKAALRNLGFSMQNHYKKENIHVGQVQVCGLVKPGTPFDPDLIAKDYYRVHTEKINEIVYGGNDNTSTFYKAPAKM